MLKKLIPFFVLGALVFTGTFIAMAGDAPCTEIKDVIVFESAKKMVTFSHAKHTGYVKEKCVTCHHKDEAGKEQGCGIEGCHPKKKSSPDDKSITKKNALHKQCKNCHKAEAKGPFKKCSDCHVLKEKKK